MEKIQVHCRRQKSFQLGLPLPALVRPNAKGFIRIISGRFDCDIYIAIIPCGSMNPASEELNGPDPALVGGPSLNLGNGWVQGHLVHLPA